MGLVGNWVGVIKSPFETFERLKQGARARDSFQHYLVLLIPQIFLLLLSLVSLKASVIAAALVPLVIAIVGIAIGVFITFAIARFLGGKGTWEQHVLGQGILSAAYAIFAFILVLILGIAAVVVLGSYLLSMGGGAAAGSGVLALLSSGGVVVLGIVALMVIIVTILVVRSWYYFFKSIHGFGVGRFLLFTIVSFLLFLALGWLALSLLPPFCCGVPK